MAWHNSGTVRGLPPEYVVQVRGYPQRYGKPPRPEGLDGKPYDARRPRYFGGFAAMSR